MRLKRKKIILTIENGLTLLVLAFLLSSCVHWGYRGGPEYELIKTNEVFYNCYANTIEWKINVERKMAIYFHDGSKEVFDTVITDRKSLQSKSYSTKNMFTKNVDSLTILIIADDIWRFDIKYPKEHCATSDSLWSYFRKNNRS